MRHPTARAIYCLYVTTARHLIITATDEGPVQSCLRHVLKSIRHQHDNGLHSPQFIVPLDRSGNADRNVLRMFASELVAEMPRGDCSQSRSIFIQNVGSWLAGSCREAVINFEFMWRRQNETVVKLLCVASPNASETFWFKNPNKMKDHCSSEYALTGPTATYGTEKCTLS